MFVTIVHVSVRPEHIEDFIEATKINHLASISEAGNCRFDVLHLVENSIQDSAQFVLYEAYQDEVTALAHKQTGHYLTWRETVADWMASPRKGIQYRGLFPE